MMQFVPTKLLPRLAGKKVVFEHLGKKHPLKSDYLADILHHVICKRFFTKKTHLRISSKIFREKYGMNSTLYMRFLVENNVLQLVSGEIVKRRCRTYRLSEDYLLDGISRRANASKLLERKREKRRTDTGGAGSVLSPVKQLLVDDLAHVRIDYAQAVGYVEDEYRKGAMNRDCYTRNMLTLDSIELGDLYHEEDSYGRFHTNFTVLRTHLRDAHLTIDGETLDHLDVKNCQPLLLACFLREHGVDTRYAEEYTRFKTSVLDNTFYDEFAALAGLTRSAAKKQVYKVIFGQHQSNLVHNEVFRHMYPKLWEWMGIFKDRHHYKIFSHELQKRESTLIFDRIIREVKATHPDVRLFTVHDAIYFKQKDRERIAPVFDKYLAQLFL